MLGVVYRHRQIAISLIFVPFIIVYYHFWVSIVWTSSKRETANRRNKFNKHKKNINGTKFGIAGELCVCVGVS